MKGLSEPQFCENLRRWQKIGRKTYIRYNFFIARLRENPWCKLQLMIFQFFLTCYVGFSDLTTDIRIKYLGYRNLHTGKVGQWLNLR